MKEKGEKEVKKKDVNENVRKGKQEVKIIFQI